MYNQSSDNFSGLPRRSCLTARNNVIPFCELCVSFANFAVKKIKSQRTQRFRKERKAESLKSTAWGIALRKNRLTFHVIARNEAIQKYKIES